MVKVAQHDKQSPSLANKLIAASVCFCVKSNAVLKTVTVFASVWV